MRILKYQLTDKTATTNLGKHIVAMPIGAKIIAFQLQRSVMTLWAEVEPISNKVVAEQRRFFVAGTGEEFDMLGSEQKYIGTVQDGSFVWHLYEY